MSALEDEVRRMVEQFDKEWEEVGQTGATGHARIGAAARKGVADRLRIVLDAEEMPECGAVNPADGERCVRLARHITYASHWGADPRSVWGEEVTFLGGPFGYVTADFRYLPPRVEVAGMVYVRVDDPDNGVPLGAYAFEAGDS